MKIIFSKYAQLELQDAIISYELEFKGLGQKFKQEIQKAVIRIAEYP